MKSYLLSKDGFKMKAFIVLNENNVTKLIIASNFDEAVKIYKSKCTLAITNIYEANVAEIIIEEGYETNENY